MTERLHKGAGAGRKQVALTPGHSMMDWIRLTQSKGRLLAGISMPRPVSEEELATHCSDSDMWMAIRGRVYNVTAYLPFHPGGVPEMVRGAGLDATNLFDSVHPWVNFESMLEKCLVGFLVPSAASSRGRAQRLAMQASKPRSTLTVPTTYVQRQPVKQDAKAKDTGNKSDDGDAEDLGSFAVPMLPRKVKPAVTGMPRRDWYQTSNEVTLVYYIREANLTPEAVYVQIDSQVCQVSWMAPDGHYQLLLDLAMQAKGSAAVFRQGPKLLIRLAKVGAHHWPQLGQVQTELFTPRPPGGQHQPDVADFTACSLLAVYRVTHDTSIYRFRGLPAHADQPLGHHLRVKVSAFGRGRGRFGKEKKGKGRMGGMRRKVGGAK